MKLVKAAFCVVALAAFSQTAIAAEKGSLEVKTVVEKVETVAKPDGETTTRLVPVESIVPGEEVVYTVSYTNVSSTATDNVTITNPIPASLSYVEGTAFGPGTEITFSIDGGTTYAAGEELTVEKDGFVRPARAEDYTNIRWVVQNQLNAGDQGFARFRARLN